MQTSLKQSIPANGTPPLSSEGTEKKHLFDNPANVTRLLRIFFAICLGLVGVEFFFHRHVVHAWENLWGFYALYGFVACVALVLIATQMRKVLMRDEDYYEK
ncbi:MAG: hypothetical protein KJO08_01805 [Gammaproteobacteria bacterium]|nr:hypothetical protein [Gammaproteobacteria bacterium]NNJ83841.1 hypothetical protein [Gammaproteobacteria bacterium]